MLGCWDVYCPICGTTCNSSETMYKWFIDNIKEYKQLVKKETLSKNEKSSFKFVREYFEITQKDPTFINKFKKLNKITKWINKCSILLTNNKVIHNISETQCNVVFCDKQGNCYEHIVGQIESQIEKTENRGIFIHTDCWKYINREYNMTLKFGDLPVRQESIYLDKIFPYINQGKIKMNIYVILC